MQQNGHYMHLEELLFLRQDLLKSKRLHTHRARTLLHVLFRAVLQNRNGAVRPKCIPTDKIKKNWTLKKGWELFLDKKHFIIPVRTGRGSEKSRGSGVTPSAWGNGFSASCTHLYIQPGPLTPKMVA